MSPYTVTIVTTMDQVHVGVRVKQLRERFGWTQGQLADRTELARSYITRVELGERNPKRETLNKLAAAFGVTVDHLLQGTKVVEVGDDNEGYVDPRIDEITANLLTMRNLSPEEVDRVAIIVAAMTEDLKRRRKEEDDAERRRNPPEQP